MTWTEVSVGVVLTKLHAQKENCLDKYKHIQNKNMQKTSNIEL